MDSLDLVEISMEFERDFSVDIPDEEMAVLRRGTAADLWRLIVRLRTGTEPPVGPPPPGDATWLRLRHGLARVLGRPLDDIGPDLPLST
jgi:hypothetical protein